MLDENADYYLAFHLLEKNGVIVKSGV